MSENRLRKIVSHHLSRSWQPDDESDSVPIASRASEHKLRLGLKLLRIIPWSMFALFIVSFFWDFDHISLFLDSTGTYVYSHGEQAFALIRYSAFGLPEFNRILELEGLIVTVSAAGLIGFFTNWLAITMLFHPRQPRPLLGHGIIPGSRDRVADLIALAISKDLISEEVILDRIRVSGVVPKYREMALQVTENLLLDENFQTEIKSLIRDFLTEKLASRELKEKFISVAMDMIDSAASRGLAGVAMKAYQMFNRDGLRRQIEEAIDDLPTTVDFVVDELTRNFHTLPTQIAKRSDDIELWLTKAIMSFVSTLDIYDMVSKNLRGFDDRRFENLIKSTSSHQLIYIKYLGGALGSIGGLVIFDQWIALPLLAMILGTIVSLDYLILWIMKRRQGAKMASQ
ncbi:MAG: DUF445 family protein [Bacteroidetes bacterium]|nr:DUF445 family protein [Bacteroidota bacterium]